MIPLQGIGLWNLLFATIIKTLQAFLECPLKNSVLLLFSNGKFWDNSGMVSVLIFFAFVGVGIGIDIDIEYNPLLSISNGAIRD